MRLLRCSKRDVADFHSPLDTLSRHDGIGVPFADASGILVRCGRFGVGSCWIQIADVLASVMAKLPTM